MITTTFYGCCGLRVIADIQANALPTTQNPAQDQVFNQIRSILFQNPTMASGGQKNVHNSSLIVLNQGQQDAYGKALISLGYEIIKEFPNWNERKQPLYLYFKEGGLKADLPTLPEKAPQKVKDETPRKSSTASR